jgi:hypothetical protein
VDLAIRLGISLIGFSLIAVLLLRFTAQPGLRVWSFVVFVLLCYPLAIGYALAYDFLDLPGIRGQGSRFNVACFYAGIFVVPPAIAWGSLRLCIAARKTPALLLILPFLALVGVFLRVAAVPVRSFPSSWMSEDRTILGDLEPDSVLLAAIARAKKDYLIKPASVWRGLHFERAYSVSPNDAYLVFYTDSPHDGIVYRCAREDGHLLWKAQWWRD